MLVSTCANAYFSTTEFEFEDLGNKRSNVAQYTKLEFELSPQIKKGSDLRYGNTHTLVYFMTGYLAVHA